MVKLGTIFSNKEFRSNCDLFLKEEFCGKEFFFHCAILWSLLDDFA